MEIKVTATPREERRKRKEKSAVRPSLSLLFSTGSS
jgi:hypothetical protein